MNSQSVKPDQKPNKYQKNWNKRKSFSSSKQNKRKDSGSETLTDIKHKQTSNPSYDSSLNTELSDTENISYNYNDLVLKSMELNKQSNENYVINTEARKVFEAFCKELKEPHKFAIDNIFNTKSSNVYYACVASVNKA
jgi:hypothetical protein